MDILQNNKPKKIIALNKMNAIRFHEYGGPEVLQFDELKLPHPTGKEVLFKVSAFALNQADLLFINGYHYTQANFPSRIGSEATGEVIAVGKDVQKFKEGDIVTAIPFYTQEYGVQGDHALVPETYLTRVPEKFSVLEATSFWMQYLTAYFALFKMGMVKKGDWVFIPATSGSAGQGALKLAKDAGARVIASTRTDAKKSFIEGLGAEEVIITQKENTLERLKKIVGAKGLKFVFDPIGGSFNKQYMGAMSFGGTAAIYGLLSGEETIFPILDIVRSNSKLLGYSMFNYVMDPELLEEGKAYILDRIAQKNSQLEPRIDKVFKYKDTIDAYNYMLSNKQKGKIVVTV